MIHYAIMHIFVSLNKGQYVVSHLDHERGISLKLLFDQSLIPNKELELSKQKFSSSYKLWY